MRWRLGIVGVVLALLLAAGVAQAATKPPPNSHFRRAEAISAIEFRCSVNNYTLCRVPLKRLRNMGTRGSSRIYCGIGIPLSGSHKGNRQRYRAVVARGEVPHARQVRTCRR